MTTALPNSVFEAKASDHISSPLTFQATNYTPSVNLKSPYPPNTTFPLALTPDRSQRSTAELISAVKHLTETKTIRSLLTQHSAIYFKDLGLQNADEFSQFVKAFGWSAHEDIGNPVRRTEYAFNVATANEGPNTQPVYPHNEFGLSPHYPAYVFFFCHSAPETGGETPINSSVILYKALKELVPQFIEDIEKKGVTYQLFYPNTPREDTTSGGTSVLQSYGKHVLATDSTDEARGKVESEIRRL